MLDLLVLPFTWLLFWLLGLLSARRTIVGARLLCVAFSAVFLLSSVGPTTTWFYFGVGLGAVLCGEALVRLQDPAWRRGVLTAAVVAHVLVIIGYLIGGQYLRKSLPYLPSLSYLGFRAIAHLVSSYRRTTRDVSAGLAQMFFLPVVFIGPITRPENFARVHLDYYQALRRLAWGLAMLIAASFAEKYVPGQVTAPGIPVWRYWVGLLANALHFYWTFAGYTHLVIGLGVLAGFQLPDNFNNPYFASSISDFWRRWHMSLSFWVRDYIYIPLGGNRKGITRKCVNLLIAMTIMGLWHGITLNYLVWGVAHGMLLAGESAFAHRGWDPIRRLVGERLDRGVKMGMTFLVVSILWLFFRYSFGDVGHYLTRLLL